LLASTFCGFGGFARRGMDLIKREMAEDVLDFAGVYVLAFDVAIRALSMPPAIWAFKI